MMLDKSICNVLALFFQLPRLDRSIPQQGRAGRTDEQDALTSQTAKHTGRSLFKTRRIVNFPSTVYFIREK